MPNHNHNSPPPITYSEYPKWLQHASLAPVIVYDPDQEAEHTARGYMSAQTPDAAESYLVAKATLKLDDAIRTMNARIESRITDGLRDLYTKVVNIIQVEMGRKARDDYGDEIDEREVKSWGGVEQAFDAASKTIAVDAMQEVRNLVHGGASYRLRSKSDASF